MLEVKGMISAGAIFIASVGIAGSAHATTLTVFNSIADGVSAFDAAVTGTGGTVNVDIWNSIGSGASIDRGDYVITQNDGGSAAGFTDVSDSLGNTLNLSGQVIGINPSGGGSFPRTDPMDYFGSGVTFTFDNPVNSVGFEVSDWATCCFDPVSDLFISFDGGAPIKVASADETSDGLFPNPSSLAAAIFVAAFDDSGDFNTVSFWGNGIGEVLNLGGQVRYALIDQGSLPPDNTSPIPLPAAGWLLLAGIGGLAAMRRKATR